MSILKDYAKKAIPINDLVKLDEGDVNPKCQLGVESDPACLSLPLSDELTTSIVPEKINESHLFVVAGQECICLTETIPQKPRKILRPRKQL